jgi:gas vesicle protein
MITKREKLLYLLAGTGIGVVTGMLLSPSSGRDLRHKLSSSTANGFDSLARTSRKLVNGSELKRRSGETIRSVVDKGKNIVSMTKARASRARKAARDNYIDPTARGVSGW